MQNLLVLILAAGRGERMRSALPKVLHPLSGRPLFSYVLETAEKLKPKKILAVVGHQAASVKKLFPNKKVEWVLQKEQLGTAHAVLSAASFLKGHKGPLLILSGDVPLLRLETLRSLQTKFEEERASLAFLTTELFDPSGYGRVVRDGDGEVDRIVEEKEASPEQKELREINAGIYLAETEEILKPLREIRRSPLKKEYYLTDLVEHLLREGKKVVSVFSKESGECLGINDRSQLAGAEELLRQRINLEWMKKGVSLRHPSSIWISSETVIEPDVIIHPGVIINGRSRISRGAEIFPYSVVEDSVVGVGARIGPFARLRPGSFVGEGARVGNFVELKKTVMKKGAKANHLTYLGDAVVGEGANVGCGTITCNYDGFRKNRTVIGKKVFIGSDVQLVAPVTIGDNAWVGAGTTVTKAVPSGSLAVSRVEQKNIKGWVKQKRKKEKKRG
ncbi:MAG: bifunctional UDP-N-acetylglucosamine diphosphorylase/glucosamine-1-phosphate N-acetyltransferase GlmU [Deltaproteobacteria bacterium]|nr:bifunctional UDP-N-acetylglucosamine diphosphorylase/glucosamine-1-phosphate N-acetyltransferase GlmU [Deltaproteobacteria bacterium]